MNMIDIEKLERVIDHSSQSDKEDEHRRQKYVQLVYRSMQRKKMIKRSVWVATSSLTILIIAFLTFGPKSSLSDSLELYKEFYKPADFQTEYRGKQPEKSLFSMALQKYATEDYKSAAILADTLQKTNVENPDHLFLIASIYQACGIEDQAEHFYRSLILLGGSYSVETYWYLGLLSLKEGKRDLCKDYLRKILESGDIAHLESAKRLLARL